MTNRIRLLAAVAAIALPAAMTGAQTPAPANPAPQPTTGAVPPPAQPVTPTTNTATEDVQESATPTPPAAPDPVDANAEPATQAPPTQAPVTQTEVTTQAQTATTPPEPQLPVQAQAETQTQVQAQAEAGPTVLATAADIRTGIQVHDQAGGPVGTIESVDATGAVVATGTVRAKLPLTSFGRNNQGLVISLTRAQLEAAAQQAQPVPS